MKNTILILMALISITYGDSYSEIIKTNTCKENLNDAVFYSVQYSKTISFDKSLALKYAGYSKQGYEAVVLCHQNPSVVAEAKLSIESLTEILKNK